MIDIRSVSGIFLVNKTKPFVISVFITYKSIENVRKLMRMKNLYIFFAPRGFGDNVFSPLSPIKEIRLISCEKRGAILDTKIGISLYPWLDKTFPFLTEIWAYSPLDKCTKIFTEIVERYSRHGWLRTPLFSCKGILIAQEKNENIQELREMAMGYLYLTKC